MAKLGPIKSIERWFGSAWYLVRVNHGYVGYANRLQLTPAYDNQGYRFIMGARHGGADLPDEMAVYAYLTAKFAEFDKEKNFTGN